MVSHTFDGSILRAYDIRGVFQETLHIEDAYVLGRVFATYLKDGSRTVVVGRDGRLSSPALAEKLIQGLIDGGVKVKDVGLGPTPMIYFAQKYLHTDAGIMISGSHNPGHYNGFKMCLASRPIFGEDIQQLGQLAQAGGWISGQGSVEEIDVSDPYIDHIVADFNQHYPSNSALKIAWDPGNGAAGELVEKLISRLSGQHVVINATIDGHFPNHHPDPSVEKNLEQLKRSVQENGCAFGLAFDGDGDRLGVVDSYGRVIWGDMLVALFAEEVLHKHPGSPVILDIKSSKTVVEFITARGGAPTLYRTGHSYIKAYMKETGAPLAGELSGHMFFADRYYGFDDALYAALRFIGRFSEAQDTPASWLDSWPEAYTSPELFFESTAANKFTTVAAIADHLRTDKVDFIEVDGIRVETAEGWWLLRASNTQDILVGRLEAFSAQGLERVRQNMKHYLKPQGLEL